MAQLFGTDYDRAALLRRIGNLNQVAGIREFTYSSGRADGVKAVEINTGPLACELLPSRCLDISRLSYKGIPAAYLSKSGIRHPSFYSKTDPTAFHDNFFAGALSTCGLHNIGPAREAGGRVHQLHGDIGNMPAEQVAVGEGWAGDDCMFSVKGVVHHSSFYHGDLLLRRTVTARLGGRCVYINDEVENLDFAPAPCLMLYHCQFGFPFLDAATTLRTSPSTGIEPRDDTAAAGLATHAAFADPADGAPEQCFYHTLTPGESGWAAACLFNPRLGPNGMGVYVRYHTDTLPELVQWKMLRSREYVCGLEPSSARLDERSDADMAALTLAPLEKRRYRLELGFVEGEDGVHDLLHAAEEHA
ncbi:MAG: aldose 1-epimerase family protein [Planctomycetaceae bacterium]|nr:aldose 1-epimerase family protein [Planctomycetaceae bacterium]